MLKVRAEQMEAFRQDRWERFNLEMQRFVRPLVGEGVSDQRLGKLVEDAIHKAESYGISEKKAMQRFFVYLFDRRSGLLRDESSPAIQGILRNPVMTGDDKVDELDAYYQAFPGE